MIERKYNILYSPVVPPLPLSHCREARGNFGQSQAERGGPSCLPPRDCQQTRVCASVAQYGHQPGKQSSPTLSGTCRTGLGVNTSVEIYRLVKGLWHFSTDDTGNHFFRKSIVFFFGTF